MNFQQSIFCSPRRRVRLQLTPGFFSCYSGEGEICFGVEGDGGAFAGEEAGIGSGGNHSGVVRGKGAAGEMNGEACAPGFGFERATELAIRSDAAGNENRAKGLLRGGGKCARDEIVHHGALKAGNQIESVLRRKSAERIRGAFAAVERRLASFDFRLKPRIAAEVI